MASLNTSNYLNLCLSSVVFIFLLNFEMCLGQAQRVQYIQLFNVTADCRSIPMANLTLDSTVRYANVTSIRVNGMWGIIGRVNGTLDYNKIVYINNDGACTQIQTSNLTLVDRVGELDMAQAQISLFLQPGFMDKPWVADPLKGFNPPLMTVKSWAFSGNEAWTLFEGTNFGGKRTCLQPNAQVRARGYGITADDNTNIVVRSVRYGCTQGGAGGQKNAMAVLTLLLISLFTIVQCH